ncbi:MAG: hypothetical protein J0M15_14620 [Deltaproteobacteria bacterium]|nr:hypothetical protein [Deltaproteobacteria bacterium]
MKLKFIGSLFLLFSVQVLKADSLHVYDGKDITKLVEYFATKVKTLKKSVTVFSWSQGGEVGDQSAQLERAKALSHVFWDRFGTNGNSYMYGYGLYTSVDPVTTHSYGSSDTWVLLELNLPIGFKLLDFTYDYTLSENQRLQDNAKASDFDEMKDYFQCESFQNINSLFENGGERLKSKCKALVKKIFFEILKIDGFSYSYGETLFKVCQNRNFIGRAIVITGEKWLKPGFAQFYNAKTIDLKDNRIRIQTLFFDALQSIDPKLSFQAKQVLTDFLTLFPTYKVKGSKSSCRGDQCEVFLTLCETETTCKDLAMGTYPRPGGGLITSQEAMKTQRGKLLWQDLEGLPKSTTTKEWLQKNKFGCTGELPYEK